MGEGVTHIPRPARTRAIVNAGEVPVERYDVANSVAPTLDIIEQNWIGGLPIASVDELLATQILAQVAYYFTVEVAHRLAKELKLIDQALGFVAGLRLCEFPSDIEAHASLRDVVLATFLKCGRDFRRS